MLFSLNHTLYKTKMLFPIRCLTCNKVIGHMHRIYESMKENHTNDEIFNKLKVIRYCCKRMFLSHINYFDMYNQYDKASFPFIKSTYSRRVRDGGEPETETETESDPIPQSVLHDGNGEEQDDDDDLLLLDRNDEDDDEEEEDEDENDIYEEVEEIEDDEPDVDKDMMDDDDDEIY